MAPVNLDLKQPRRVSEILATAVRLFARYPVLFISLALIVVVPYGVLVVLVAGSSPLSRGHSSASTFLLLLGFALVVPLVAALQVQAVQAIGEGRRPRLPDVVRQGARTLPVVVAAEIIADICIGVGFFVLIVPGIILWMRFFVVAQAAAIERTDWPTAIRRSGQLVRRNYLRVFGVLVAITLFSLVLIDLGAALAGSAAIAVQLIVVVVIELLNLSFQGITTAVLYFDLRAREQAVTTSGPRN